jgi:hypothetical protein
VERGGTEADGEEIDWKDVGGEGRTGEEEKTVEWGKMKEINTLCYTQSEVFVEVIMILCAIQSDSGLLTFRRNTLSPSLGLRSMVYE